MKPRNVIIALLIVFALGGVLNESSFLDGSRSLSRVVNRAARWGLRWALWYRIRKPQSVHTVGPDEIDHRRAL